MSHANDLVHSTITANETVTEDTAFMKRRSTIALLAAVLANGLRGRPRHAQGAEAEAMTTRQVIVIGAGLSGLAAARELRVEGQDVLVLEARDRIGGRLWTSNKWSDMPLDLGASWIHGVTGNPLTELAEEAEAELLETSYERSILYDSSGSEISDRRQAELERLRRSVHKAWSSAQKADEDASVRQVTAAFERQLQASDETRQLLNFIISSELEQEYAGSATQLSAHWYDSARSFDGEDKLFEEGYQVIVDHLADGLTVRTGEIVKRIDWSDDSVRVTTGTAEYSAKKVLVTLPLGVLKAGSVQFVPPLPESTTTAISKLGMGVLNKCYLRFPEVFWPDDVDWLEYIPEKHGEWTEWVSFARAAGQPILLGFNAGDHGRAIEAMTDKDIVASAMKTLRVIFGEGIPDPEDFQITRWASDPFALGSYSFNSVGSHPRMRGQLAQPLKGRLYFAGEATDRDYFGTAHGAYLSGLRAAEEILR